MWNSIVNVQFPPQLRFITRAEEKNDLGFSDLGLYLYKVPSIGESKYTLTEQF